MTYRFTIIAFTVILLCACGNHKEERDQAEIADSGMEYNYVDTMSLSLGVFNRQLVCNGRLRAILKSDLPMPASGYVTTINVTTGSHVVKGQILATTGRFVQMAGRKSPRLKEKWVRDGSKNLQRKR